MILFCIIQYDLSQVCFIIISDFLKNDHSLKAVLGTLPLSFKGQFLKRPRLKKFRAIFQKSGKYGQRTILKKQAIWYPFHKQNYSISMGFLSFECSSSKNWHQFKCSSVLQAKNGPIFLQTIPIPVQAQIIRA